MKTISKSGFWPASALTLIFLVSNGAQAESTLSSDQLKDLLIGNFLKIVYISDGEGINMWEYYQKDGNVAGSTDKWGNYSATYEINDDNKICLTYGGESPYNGCYAYEHISDNNYRLVGLTWPENSTANVTIVKGLYDNIGN